MKRNVRSVFGIVLAASAAIGCSPVRPEGPPPRPVRLQRIAPSQPSGELRYSAVVQPQAQILAAFKVGGYVREIARRADADGRMRLLQQGDVVRQGTMLARIDDRDYAQKVARARAQRAGAAATFDRARTDADRARRLYEADSLTRVDNDAAQASLAVASSNLAAADSDLEVATLTLNDTALRASSDAIVLSRGIEEGALASPGTLAFTLADVSRMKVVFGVPEKIARSLEVGRELELTLESSASPVAGRITAVAPSADSRSRVFAVEVTLPNPGGELRSGTIATVRVPAPGGRASASPAVPLGAVVRSPGKRDGYAVFVVVEEGGRRVARARDVELGPIVGNAVHVTSGLSGVDEVVVLGASLLADGEPVSVLE